MFVDIDASTGAKNWESGLVAAKTPPVSTSSHSHGPPRIQRPGSLQRRIFSNRQIEHDETTTSHVSLSRRFCKHGRDADSGAGRRDLADSGENQGEVLAGAPSSPETAWPALGERCAWR